MEISAHADQKPTHAPLKGQERARSAASSKVQNMGFHKGFYARYGI